MFVDFLKQVNRALLDKRYMTLRPHDECLSTITYKMKGKGKTRFETLKTF